MSALQIGHLTRNSQPLSNYTTLSSDSGMLDQTPVATIATAPIDLAAFFINTKYEELGGPSGILGVTSSAVFAANHNAGLCGHSSTAPSIGMHRAAHTSFMARSACCFRTPPRVRHSVRRPRC